MSRFKNDSTGVVVSVDDSKDARFESGWTREVEPESKPAAKKASK